ncbi:glycosyltransferase [Ornithinimicrobium cerasi]|uniref:D-inositol 3-phosphate glycosyltransferase n=1 Tax=Ornithinimicrobium cerasi TaxID=2248773 RepID=A0A285VLE3_9MICO|nr:glycosyltransferase [Ornithinimicrobium cerasi]SOC54904.1 alpha-1,6-mannosyltransferase [Ornithinimicrobium cerasi]
MHILRVANFVSPTSGGIKTALRAWGEHYRSHGHRASLIIPGPGPEITEESQGTVYRVPATPIPGTGYSLMFDRSRLSRLMDAITPDVIEVSDRATTRWMGRWARRRGIGSVMISHENMTGIMVRRTPVPDRPATWAADLVNRRSAHDYDAIVTPSRFSAEEFERIGVHAHVVPLGVELDVFRPHRDPNSAVQWPPPPGRTVQLVHCGRLSPEKRPALSIETVRELVRRGHDVQMTVFGDGPMRGQLMERAQNLPILFHAYITSRSELAARMGSADVAVAPGPLETFGLAALEVMACGVPTVCTDEGALQEVVGTGGCVAPSTPAAFADGVETLLRRPGARRLAREQAERFNWEASSQRMLAIHEDVRRRVPASRP